MDWTRWILAALVLLSAGWMILDGSRALLKGDYITPGSGPRAGQLGPWAAIVSAVGISPQSSLMKWTFVVLGIVYLGMGVAFLLGAPWAKVGLIVIAALGLWYLPFGTLINILVILLVILIGMRGTG
jgi:hypothetical protein